ncbi:MAG: ArnT family glycosyltransferase [Cytophagaceae bacterium]
MNRNSFSLLIVLIHGIYFSLGLYFGQIYTLDSPEYLYTAVNIKNHFTSYNWNWDEVRMEEFYTLRPPLYGLFILLFKSIVNSDFFVLFIQNLLSIWICLKLYFVLKTKSSFKNPGTIILISLLLFPPYLILVNSVLADLLLLFWIFLAFIFLLKFIKTTSHKWLFFYNLSLATAVMTKPVMMFFWIPNLLFCLYLYFKYQRSYLTLIYSLILPVTVLCWSLRNDTVTGYFHFSSIKMQNILELNAGNVLSLKYDREYEKRHREEVKEKAAAISSFPERSEFLIATSVDIIKENPIFYIYTHIKGMFNFMLAPGRIDLMTFFPPLQSEDISLLYELEKDGFNGLIYYVSKVNLFVIVLVGFVFLFNVVTLVAFLAGIFSRTMEPVSKYFIYLLVAYIVFVCGSGGYARFKMSVLPFVIFAFPYGVEVISALLAKVFSSNKKLNKSSVEEPV